MRINSGRPAHRIWSVPVEANPPPATTRPAGSHLEIRRVVLEHDLKREYPRIRTCDVERILPRASDLWVRASLDYKERLQQLFFPEGIAFDGDRFSRRRLRALTKEW
jgi:hypothetical protein